MGKVCFTCGYQCFLTITERSEIKHELKATMIRLTRYSKSIESWTGKRRVINRKKRLAKILSKIENLFPLEDV